MPIINFHTITSSPKSAHATVEINDREAGEVWREQVHVHDRKGRQSLKWRWFARCLGDSRVLGQGTRAALILAAGFPSRNKAADALYAGREAQLQKEKE